MGATEPGCASRQASSSAKRTVTLRSRHRWIGKTESAKLRAIRASQRSRGNGRGDQDPAIFCCDPQNFWIERAERDCARGRPEAYRRLSSEQSFPNGGIYVSISFKADFYPSLVPPSFLVRSKR